VVVDHRLVEVGVVEGVDEVPPGEMAEAASALT
jgi:hypothetical protein